MRDTMDSPKSGVGGRRATAQRAAGGRDEPSERVVSRRHVQVARARLAHRRRARVSH